MGQLGTCLLHQFTLHIRSAQNITGLEIIKLEVILKVKRNDWLLVDTCPQAANHCAFTLSLRLYSSFITSGPGLSNFVSLIPDDKYSVLRALFVE